MEKLEMLLALFAVVFALALPVLVPLAIIYYIIVFMLASQNDIGKKMFLFCLIPFAGLIPLVWNFWKELR